MNGGLHQEGKEDLPKLVCDEDNSKIQKNADKEVRSQLVEGQVSPNNDSMETNSKGLEENHLPPKDGGDMDSYEKSDVQVHSSSTSKGSQADPKVDPSFLEDENFDCFTVTLNKGSKSAFGFKLKRSLSTRRGGHNSKS